MALALPDPRFVLTVLVSWLIGTHSLETSKCMFYDNVCKQTVGSTAAVDYCSTKEKVCRDDNPHVSTANTFCYNLSIRDVHGNVTILKSDCWENLGPECKDNVCRYSGNNGYFYCCCQGDLCNSVLLASSTVSDDESTTASPKSLSLSSSPLDLLTSRLLDSSLLSPTSETSKECDVCNLTELTTACIAVGTAVAILVVIVSAWLLYNKRRLRTVSVSVQL